MQYSQIIITIIFCGVQVHLLLGEKVKVSQTSQSRPAALHTAHSTLHTAQIYPAAVHSLTTPSSNTMQCHCDAVRWCCEKAMHCKLTDSQTCSVVLRSSQGEDAEWDLIEHASTLLIFHRLCSPWHRGKPVKLYNCFAPSTIEKAFFGERSVRQRYRQRRSLT